MTCVFWSYSQIAFRGVSPQAVVGNYEFTYTSNKAYTNSWGADLSVSGFRVEDTLELVHSTDTLGCGVYLNNKLKDKIAFIYRGDCTFYEKVKKAQDNGAIGVVIVNNEPTAPVDMAGSLIVGENALINIPVVQISKADGAKFRAQMELGPVVVIMGNLSGYLKHNLAIYKSDLVVPKAYGTPKLTVSDSTEMVINLAGFLFNRGSDTVKNAKLKVEVKKGNNVLYSLTSEPFTMPGKSDTAVNFLGQRAYYLAKDTSIGKYEVVYSTISEDDEDLDPSDDTLRFNFEITDNIYSLTPLDEEKKPIATTFTRSGNEGLTKFTQCIKYRNSNAERIGAEGIYFSAKIDSGSIDLEEFTIEAFEWSDIFNDTASIFSVNFNNLIPLNETSYQLPGNLEGKTVYVPFSESVEMTNDVKYLFCVTPTNPKISLGYTNERSYRLNDIIYAESIHPNKSRTTSDTWYPGFIGGQTPAMAIRTAAFETLGLSNNIKSIEGSVYPNPATDEVTLSLKAEGKFNLMVTDVTGKVVMENTTSLNNGISKVNINSLQSGMYFFNVVLENGTAAQYTVVKR